MHPAYGLDIPAAERYLAGLVPSIGSLTFTRGSSPPWTEAHGIAEMVADTKAQPVLVWRYFRSGDFQPPDTQSGRFARIGSWLYMAYNYERQVGWLHDRWVGQEQILTILREYMVARIFQHSAQTRTPELQLVRLDDPNLPGIYKSGRMWIGALPETNRSLNTHRYAAVVQGWAT